MSRIVVLTVTCDGFYHLGEPAPLTVKALNMKAARAGLRRGGWSFPRGGAVYCPTCTKTRNTVNPKAI
jgi:hypothetical protein